ncbi:ComEC/Rec2 family competence protein [Pedobacter rhizosphaerae]|uniref:Competence protein ComEC n=1 Tax=Pedobacter rhizosphaerae TaxID=390241 RepID=A0A1H9S048_9SPHI|nr:ComEC/Rec2 family competence protein [Pedobacter rhizosphaerae]SER78314.1 competence protein ComEC [Pedobacter rhizosphaerae]
MFKAEYIFVRILVPFVIGIGLAYFLQSDRYFWVFALIHLIALSFLIVANLKYQQLSLYRFKGTIGVVFLLLFFSLGALICLMNCQSMQKDYFGKKQYTALKIWITDEPQITNHISRFKGRVTMAYQGHKCEQVSGTLLIAIKLDSTEVMPYQYGEELVISCSALPVEPPYNPAEFDFQSWLANQNIYLQAFVKHKQVIKTNKNVGNTLVQFALQLWKNQINKYRNLIKNDEAFAVASTLILGYRADLSNQTLAAYTKTGTIHALSVSGAHVAIIYVVINFLLSFMDRRKNLKILKLILICTIIWNYALITGLSPSVIRSAIMITVFMVCKTFAKTGNSYNILAFSAFLQLIYNPFLLWDVGFQLSYLAVFGLLYLQPKIYNWFFIRHKWLDKLWNFIALSLAAQMVSFPLSLYYFHQFPVYFLLANLFISLPLVVMMYLGIIILIPGMGFLSPILEWIINSTNLILKWMANLPFATISSVWISFPQFILLSLALSL